MFKKAWVVSICFSIVYPNAKSCYSLFYKHLFQKAKIEWQNLEI